LPARFVLGLVLLGAIAVAQQPAAYRQGKIASWDTVGVVYGGGMYAVHQADKFVYHLQAPDAIYDFQSWNQDFTVGQEVQFRIEDQRKGKKIFLVTKNGKEKRYEVSGERPN
jgi:hypothetical protein